MPDYIEYALRQLQSALLKREDAPAASAGHERSALLALQLERCPTIQEWNDSWSDESRAERAEAALHKFMCQRAAEKALAKYGLELRVLDADVEAMMADLEFARASHLAWAEHLEHHQEPCAECEEKPYKLDAAHEREWVAKYDRIIALVKDLL